MNDQQLLRYSRHILLDEIGIEGQEKLRAAHALILGAGGLGSPAALYLAAAGVGRITLVDDDVVDLTNLQRQILHTTARIGLAKTESGAAGAGADQSGSRSAWRSPSGSTARGWTTLLADVSVALDCTDNFATRHALNRACVGRRVPLVSGAAIRFDGQISVFDARSADLRPATPACSRPSSNSRKSVAPAWACSRRWSASSARCRRPRR